MIDRPFDAEILRRARQIAARYRIVLEPDERVGYVGSSLELPNVYADGRSADAAVSAVREALAATVAYLIESGRTPPAPAQDQARTKQVNVRLTEVEQLQLREAARAAGFTDLSDFVRSRSLAS